MSDLADRLAGLSPAKRALFEALKQKAAGAQEVRPRAVRSPTPLSFAQERLWLLDRLDPGNAAYVVAHGVRFGGPLDAGVVDRAMALLAERHEALRTTFAEVDGQPVQVIAEAGATVVEHIELTEPSASAVSDEIAALARATFERPFDLERGPLWRVVHVAIAPDDHALLFAMHHIVSDAGSLEQLVREFAVCCASLAQGVEPRLPALPIQFADYAVWQRNWFTGTVREQQLDYWTSQLADLEPVDLPTDAPRPPVQTFRGRVHRTELPATVAEGIRQLGRQHGTTAFMTMLAGFVALLSRYSRQGDIVVGSPVTNRTRAELEHVVGLFANTIVLRVDCAGGTTVADLLARTRQAVLDAHAHQDLPFEQLVERLQPVRDLARNPLFQVFFIHRRHARDEHAFGASTLDLPSTTTKFDVTLTVDEAGDRFWTTIEYNVDLFSEDTIARMTTHLQSLLASMAANASARIDDLPMLAASERASILAQARAARASEAYEPVPGAFARIAAARPEHPAVVAPDDRMSYAALADRSGRIAALLRARGIGEESTVAICLDRTTDLVAAALGVLRAGAAYIPLDPSFPAERLRLMLDDARPASVVSSAALRPLLPSSTASIIALDEPAVAGELASLAPSEDAAIEPEQLAYVIYTSGSTGQPKGVQIAHRALANLLASMRREPGLDDGDRLLAVTTFSFDIAGLELWLPLTTGATVVLASREDARDGDRLAALADRERVTIVQATPSTWRLLLDAGWPAKAGMKALVGGEVVPAALARALLARSARVWNVYGPTETTVWSTVWPVAEAREAVPIGRPIDGTDAYVLDERFECVPHGVIGELFLGGAGLARGYRGRADLTADRFVPDPHAIHPGARMYRTGDLARLRTDGAIEFVGRRDDQVKLRGFRIELGDVETAVAAEPSVDRAVAGIRPGADREPVLVCWYVPASGADVDAAALRDATRRRLPDYMVPSAFVPIASVPLTPNGKIDRRALPDPSRDRRSSAPAPPRTELERRMLPLWCEALGATDLGVDDDFFALGGHSMLAARLLTRVRQTFSVEVPLRALFETPTIAGLARVVTILSEGGTLELLTPALRSELLADARLDADVVPRVRASVSGPPHRPLLTGASGFLGAHLLADLLASTDASVCCLVRCRDEADGAARLRATLEKYELYREGFGGRIVAIPGDLEQPRLGLAPAAFEALANDVDAIYHNGALVNFVTPYRRLRPANVGGTLEVLRLACRHAVPVHYVSTMDVLGTGFLTATEADAIDEPAGLAHGYAQSKWVAEHLVLAARDRGLPCAIYRPGRVIGHSRTGIWNTEDFACRAIRGSIELGVVPDVDPIDNMAPVDFVSRAIVAISMGRRAFDQRAYHVINPAYFAWRDLFDLMRRRGHALAVVPYREWRRRLANAPDNALAPLLPLFPVPLDDSDQEAAARWTEMPTPNCAAAAAALAEAGVVCPPLDAALWDRYFDYFISAGYIAPAPR